MDNIKIVRVFIGSPGGLDEERRAAREVVNEVNTGNAEHWGCQFNLVGWEDTIPGYQRPQDKINEDLDKCDYFLGVLWNWWGTKPSKEKGEFTSGFHEEFCRARSHIESGRMKDMAIYFKSVEVPAGMEPGEPIRRVLEFRKECIAEKKVFFKDFATMDQFRNLVRNKLTEIGWRESKKLASSTSDRSQSGLSPEGSSDTKTSDSSKSWLIDEEAREFLSEMSQRPLEWEETNSHEIARFRLIGFALSRAGNDHSYLGNHDANLIYKHLKNSRLSDQEIRALIDCGIVGFSAQNVPLWHWLTIGKNGRDFFSRVSFLAVVGEDAEKKNAIHILELAGQPIPSINHLYDKEDVLRFWLNDTEDNNTFEAAISLLSANASHEDISLIEEICSECSPHRQSKIEGAIAEIISKSSCDLALQRLIEKKVDKIDTHFVRFLFDQPSSLPTSTLALCLSAKDDNLRLAAVKVLSVRNEISLEAAQTLLSDNSHEIRLIAAENLKNHGHELDDKIVKKALIIEKSAFGLGINPFRAKEKDATYYEQYLSNRLAELDYKQLREKVNEVGVFAEKELFAMYSKYKSKTQNEIRRNLNDGFKNFFNEHIKKGVDTGRYDDDFLSKISKLEEFIRAQLCSNSLSVLCKLKKEKDLPLIRKIVDEFDVNENEDILQYFARFGDWSDIDRIVNIKDETVGGTSLLSMRSTTKFPSQKASAIISIGRDRIADVLALELENTIKVSLAKQLPNKSISSLDIEILLRELNREEQDYRAIFALRCAQSLPKSRIKSLIDRYVGSDDYRYYNSIHWLDLALSLPNRLVKEISERKLRSSPRTFLF
ncbi:DUF4062 domain-containing protein [Roseibium album]|uniref:DUF4062 domain-containing protein n=1 Tax=Roseibium album TaxID=311410 RepID=UPI00329A352A